MTTLPQDNQTENTKLLQVRLTEDAHTRIKVAAARNSVSPGKVVSELASTYLPAVTGEDEIGG